MRYVHAEGGDHGSIQFIQNLGQWDPDILYQAEIQNGYLQIARDGLHYIFYDGTRMSHHPGFQDGDQSSNARLNDPEDFSPIDMHATALLFKGRSDLIKVVSEEKQTVYYNYFIGRDPSRWASKVPAYSAIKYQDIYPGIDMKLYSEQGYIKYDLIVEPGADISQIKFEYEGLESIRLAHSSLYAETSLNTIIENTPFAYQLVKGDTVKVDCRFILRGNSVSYELSEGFDSNQTLIIDPLLIFSTYSGSTADNWGNTATFDEAGNVYSGGTVRMDLGGLLPVTNRAYQREFGGIWDLAILKFDSTGSDLLYGTYLGGSGTETPFSMIVNNQNELVIFGVTGSGDFPMTDLAYDSIFDGGAVITNAIGNYNLEYMGVDFLSGSDLFIAKLSGDGSRLLASTYLGGSNNDGINNAPGFPLSRNYGDEFRGEVNIDNENNIYIVANTASEDFPIVRGFQGSYGGGTQDAIVAKLNDDLSNLIWSTYLGGSLADAAYGIRITRNGRIFCTGGTMSEDFPVTQDALNSEFGGDVDGFVTAISSNGDTLIASTFLGTNVYDQAYFLDIDQNEDVYILGQTSGTYPVSIGVYTNPLSGQFIHKLSSHLDQTLFSTVVGSESAIPDISLTAFLVNDCGNIFLSGWGGNVNSPNWFGRNIPKFNGGNTFDMPISDDAYQKVTDGSDFYLMVLSENAEKLLYGTFLGSLNMGAGEHVDGGTSRFDKRGIVYHAICACQDNSQFPTTPGVWSNINNNSNCNNGVFKFDLSSLRAAFTTNSYEFDKPGITQDCFPFEVVFLNKSIGGVSYEWDFGDGQTSDQPDSVFYLYKKAGLYDVSLSAFDENTCLKVDVATGQIRVFEPFFVVPSDQLICQFDEVELTAAGSDIYRWNPVEGLSNANIANPMASPDTTTIYYLYMKDNRDCELEDSVRVTVIPQITAEFDLQKVYDCASRPSIRIANQSLMANQYLWEYGDGTHEMLVDSIVSYQYEKPGTYTVRMFASSNGLCTQIREEKVNISDIFIPNIVTPNSDGKNETFEILTDAPVSLTIFNRWGKILYQDADYQNNWNASGLTSGIYYYELLLEDDATCNGWLQVLK
jgi:gliding motility-associated-like protein